jgi:hypothetical protein
MFNKILGMVFANIVLLLMMITVIALIALSALKVINNIYCLNDSAYSANNVYICITEKGK